MIAYLNDQNRPLQGTPFHLMAKRTDALIDSWQSTFGVRALSIDPSGIVAADISQASRESVFDWLSSVDAVAVAIEPQDVATLAGRSPLSLAMAELIRDDAATRHAVSRLELSEIVPTLEELAVLCQQASDLQRDLVDQHIASFEDRSFRTVLEHEREQHERTLVNRLRQAGFDVPDEVSFEPTVAPQPDTPAEFGGAYDRNIVVDPFSFSNE